VAETRFTRYCVGEDLEHCLYGNKSPSAFDNVLLEHLPSAVGQTAFLRCVGVSLPEPNMRSHRLRVHSICPSRFQCSERKKRLNTNHHPHAKSSTEEHSKTQDSRTPNRPATKLPQSKWSTSPLVDFVVRVSAQQIDDHRHRTKNVRDVVSLLYPGSVKALAEEKVCGVDHSRGEDTWQHGQHTPDLMWLVMLDRLLLVFSRCKIVGIFRILQSHGDEGNGCTKWGET
jgi:hypothetical protein